MTSEKIAVVTGASRGIGRALALGLASEGYRVIAMARTKAALDELASSPIAANKIIALASDLSDPEKSTNALTGYLEKFGHVDVLVNNAGMGKVGTLNVPLSEFNSLLTTNVSAPFRILQAVVPYMLEANSGMIINVASRAGKIGFAGFGSYAASKFAVVGLTEALYRELCPNGIKVTALCPSWVDTEMARQSGTTLPTEEMIQPEDLMKTINWLLALSPACCVKEIMIECRNDIR